MTSTPASRRFLKANLQVAEADFKKMSKSDKKKVIKERANWDQDWVPIDKEEEPEEEKLTDKEKAARQANYPADLFS